MPSVASITSLVSSKGASAASAVFSRRDKTIQYEWIAAVRRLLCGGPRLHTSSLLIERCCQQRPQGRVITVVLESSPCRSFDICPLLEHKVRMRFVLLYDGRLFGRHFNSLQRAQRVEWTLQRNEDAGMDQASVDDGRVEIHRCTYRLFGRMQLPDSLQRLC